MNTTAGCVVSAVALLVAGICPALAQLPPIGIIDFYGLRQIPEKQVRAALGIHEGASLPEADDALKQMLEAAKQRVRAMPGVKDVQIMPICCDAGRTILYVGVVETGARVLTFQPAPHGTARLPEDVVRAGSAFETALTQAVVKGDAGEDDSSGHTLSSNPALRAIEEQFITFAGRDAARLRDVLAHSSDSEQRALAAQMIAYGADKKSVVAPLAAAMRDPDWKVRNNAMRALAIIVEYAGSRPQLAIEVDPEPFVDLLDSPDWTDRNKALFALVTLSEKRDARLLAALRARALLSLIEMARWKSRGHAGGAFLILGRMAGLSDAAIKNAWERDDREQVIAAAGRQK